MRHSGRYQLLPHPLLKPYRHKQPLPDGINPRVQINGEAWFCGQLRIGPDVHIGNGVELSATGKGTITIDEGAIIDSHSIIRAHADDIHIGPGAYLGPGVKINTTRRKGFPYSGRVEIGDNTELGSGTEIGNNVKIGKRCYIGPDTKILYWTTICDNSKIYTSSIGVDPQDRTFMHDLDKALANIENHPELAGIATVKPTFLFIGKHCVVREGCRISRGTSKTPDIPRTNDEHHTTLDDHVDLQDHTHIAHDCHLMSYAHVGSGSKLAGHVVIHPYAYLAGAVKATPFAQIGMLAATAGNIAIKDDVPPFTLADWKQGTVRDLHYQFNRKGVKSYLERQSDTYHTVERDASKTIRLLINALTERRTLTQEDLDAAIEQHPESEFIHHFASFMTESARRKKQQKPRV